MEFHVPKQVTFIINRLREHGYEAFAVGGCVRDMLLGRVPNDWDITTSARPEQVKAVFKRTIDTGIQHGTVTVLEDRIGFEVTTYRIDGEYEDGRHPKQVEFTPDLKEDLRRRDFTINAMAYSEETGIVDVFGGQEDLKNGIIRCVGNAEDRFNEDALRIMRAVRFAAQLGFTVEEATMEAVKKLAPNLKKISAERIQVELSKLLLSPHPECFRMLYDSGITAVILPEFDQAMACEQNSPYHCMSVGEHTMAVINGTPCNLPLRLAGLLHDIGKPHSKQTDENGVDHFKGHAGVSETMARKILRRLKYDNYTTDRTCRLIRYHDHRILAEKYEVRKLMHLAGEDLFADLMKLQYADNQAKTAKTSGQSAQIMEIEKLHREIVEAGECTSLKMLAVNGRDLLAAGAAPGKGLGELLAFLLEYVLADPQKNEKEILLGYLKEQGKLQD